MSQVNSRLYDISTLVQNCYTTQQKCFSPIEYEYLLSIINQYSLKKVLDVGSGEGCFIHGLATQAREVDFVAIEADSKLTYEATSKYTNDNITFRNEMFDANFSPTSYDMILARFAVEHMKDPQGFVLESAKRLSSNGILLITEYYFDALQSGNQAWRLFRDKEYEMMCKLGSNPRVTTLIPQYMKEAGLNNIRSNYRHISPSTVNVEAFSNVIQAYAELYSQIEPEIWTQEVRVTVMDYAQKVRKGEIANEDTFLINQTIGFKSQA